MYREKIDKYFEANGDKMVEAIQSLIKIRSVHEESSEGKPSDDGIAKVLDEALKIANNRNLSVKNMENIVGLVDLNEHETELTMLAHLDVVAEGHGWTKPPFEGIVEDGKVYGRGAEDDKGPAMAALFALAAAKEIEPNLKKNARLVLGTAEETGFGDLKYYLEHEKISPKVFTPDSDFPVINIEKGRYVPLFGASWEESAELPRIVSIKGGDTLNQVPPVATAVTEGLDLGTLESAAKTVSEQSGVKFTFENTGGNIQITAHGKSSHAAEPNNGNNALTAIILLLTKLPFAPSKPYSMICELSSLFPHGDYLGKSLGIAQKDELSGELTLNLSVMDFNLTGISTRFDSRFPLCGTKENVADAAVRSLNSKGIEIKGFYGITMPHHTPEDSPFVQTLLKAYEDYTNCKGKGLAMGGSTYAHDIEGAVAFGCSMPGVDNRIHGADEFAIINDLITSAKMFTQVIIDTCK